MRCIECDFVDSRVIEKRDLEDGVTVRRRRECLKCGLRFTTYERIETPFMAVVKKDGSREPFDRKKVAQGIFHACQKRPVSTALIAEIVADIERELRATGEAEIQSFQIGELVMSRLREADDVAYVRFASVYRSFADLKSFENELNRLKAKINNKT